MQWKIPICLKMNEKKKIKKWESDFPTEFNLLIWMEFELYQRLQKNLHYLQQKFTFWCHHHVKMKNQGILLHFFQVQVRFLNFGLKLRGVGSFFKVGGQMSFFYKCQAKKVDGKCPPWPTWSCWIRSLNYKNSEKLKDLHKVSKA